MRTSDTALSCRVIGRRSAILRHTGWLSLKELPNSRVNRLRSQRQYCTGSGWHRPYWEACATLAPHCLSIFKEIAKFQSEQIAQPAPILHRQRLVESVLGAPGCQG